MKLTIVKFKHTFWITSFFILIFATPLQIKALTIEEIPNPRQENSGWVTDMAEILSDKTEEKLNFLISQLEQQNGVEIAIVTVPETNPSATPKEFTTALFNSWKIGKAEEDNGVLFLISTDDRRVEIETGYGIEEILPNAKLENIINTKITPQFELKNYDSGTLAGTQALVNILQNQKIGKTLRNKSFGLPSFLGILLVLTVVIGLLFNKRKHHRDAKNGRTSHNFVDPKSCQESSNSNGSSFGGGSSSGGGAGGSF